MCKRKYFGLEGEVNEALEEKHPDAADRPSTGF
jgi:hypothetical protein